MYLQLDQPSAAIGCGTEETEVHLATVLVARESVSAVVPGLAAREMGLVVVRVALAVQELVQVLARRSKRPGCSGRSCAPPTWRTVCSCGL